MEFDMIFDPRHGEAVAVAPGVARITAPNASPFTFHGTNSYVIGGASVVLVDPGPNDERHLGALIAAIDGRPVDAILLTHTHRDHTDLLPALLSRIDAPVLAEGPHRAARPLHASEVNVLDAAGDTGLVPDRLVADGEIIDLPAARVRVVATPGHTANHLAFAIERVGDAPGDGVLLSGDHVMAWSTSIVAPPDGAMADYMASLEVLLSRDDRLYLPGHGGAVDRPQAFVRGLRAHRRMRETAILERLKMGDRTIADIVAAIYRQTDAKLHGAAGLSVLAHLEDLVARSRARAFNRDGMQGPALLDSFYEPA